MAHFGFQDSNQPDNQYQLHCPVVDRDAVLIECWNKREHHMRGEFFPAVDCRCAMRGSKCPAMVMLALEWATAERKFFDPSPRLHRLTKEVTERIEKVQLIPYHAEGMTLTDAQSKQLFGKAAVVKGEPVAEAKVTGPASDGDGKPKRGRPRKVKD